jgi:hypothetical protein
MHISVNVYYPLFFSYLRESEIISFIIKTIHECFLMNFFLTLQDMLSEPVSLFFAFYVLSLKFIFPLILKLLMSVKYEYYGVFLKKKNNTGQLCRE